MSVKEEFGLSKDNQKVALSYLIKDDLSSGFCFSCFSLILILCCAMVDYINYEYICTMILTGILLLVLVIYFGSVLKKYSVIKKESFKYSIHETTLTGYSSYGFVYQFNYEGTDYKVTSKHTDVSYVHLFVSSNGGMLFKTTDKDLLELMGNKKNVQVE